MNDFSPDAAKAIKGPDWIVERRTAAAEELAERSLPTTALEEWRYSPVDKLDLDRYSPSSGLADPPMVPLDVEPAAIVRIVNGRIVTVEIDDEVAATGVRVGALVDHDSASDLLGVVADGAPDYFTRLNDAFAPDPVVVHIPRGVSVDRPIVISNHSAGDGVAIFPRLVIRLEPGASASVLDRHTSDVGDEILVCPVAEFDVDNSARLGYLNIQQLAPSAWQIASQVARVGQEATLTAATAGLGGAYARTRADTRLVGRGAHGDLLALYFGDEDQALDFRTYQDHVAADTSSNLLYKGVLGGRARSVYTGLIRVRPGARGTNAFQTNRNLKLGPDAWAESVPNLEIENNDVKCSHASSVSPVDEDQRFYLESRGVPTADAERLIVGGFLDEVLCSLPVPAAVPSLRSALASRIANVTELASSDG